MAEAHILGGVKVWVFQEPRVTGDRSLAGVYLIIESLWDSRNAMLLGASPIQTWAESWRRPIREIDALQSEKRVVPPSRFEGLFESQKAE